MLQGFFLTRNFCSKILTSFFPRAAQHTSSFLCFLCLLHLLGAPGSFALKPPLLTFSLIIFSMQRALTASSRASVLSSASSARAPLSRFRPTLPAGLGLQQQRFAHKVCLQPSVAPWVSGHGASIFLQLVRCQCPTLTVTYGRSLNSVWRDVHHFSRVWTLLPKLFLRHWGQKEEVY